MATTLKEWLETEPTYKFETSRGCCRFCGSDDVDLSVRYRKTTAFGERGWVAPGIPACATCIEQEARCMIFTAGQ